jgi:hypothetical protein
LCHRVHCLIQAGQALLAPVPGQVALPGAQETGPDKEQRRGVCVHVRADQAELDHVGQVLLDKSRAAVRAEVIFG